MSAGSGIEWTHAMWNRIVGCLIISPGCKRSFRTAGGTHAQAAALNAAIPEARRALQ
jgi:protein gp37